jgi:hypothetical protein
MIIDEVQRRLQLAVIVHSDEDLQRMWPQAWANYALPRYGTAESKRRQRAFERQVYEACNALRAAATRNECRLDFDVIRLRYLALKSLDCRCPYCGELYGVDGLCHRA